MVYFEGLPSPQSRHWPFAAVAALLLGFAVVPCRAQAPSSTFDLVEDLYAVSFEEAFQSPYGQAILKEFHAVLLESADKSCLQRNAISDAQLSEFGKDVYFRYGQRIVDQHRAFFVPYVAELDAAFVQRAGPGSLDELQRLATDRAVREYLRLLRPALRAARIDLVSYTLDSHLMARRYKLVRSVNPILTRKAPLVELAESESDRNAAARYAAQEGGPIPRFVELVSAYHEAFFHVAAAHDASKSTPPAYAGVERELEAHCIMPKDR